MLLLVRYGVFIIDAMEAGADICKRLKGGHTFVFAHSREVLLLKTLVPSLYQLF